MWWTHAQVKRMINPKDSRLSASAEIAKKGKKNELVRYICAD